MNDGDRVQSVRNAWINALRAEVLRVGRAVPEVARVVGIGVWIATYADADGSNAFPSRDTLATLAGCSPETVTRSVRVLTGVGVVARRRRPNASAMYQLLMPLGGGLDWAAHIHHVTETRQRKAYAKKKAEETAEAVAALEAKLARTASTDAVRTASTDRVPDSVRGGGSGPRSGGPEDVHGRPRTASVDAFRTASVAGAYQYTPTSGRDPLPDHNSAEHSPQPQDARAAPTMRIDGPPVPPLRGADEDQANSHAPQGDWAPCAVCHGPLLPDPRRPGRTAHARCHPQTRGRTP